MIIKKVDALGLDLGNRWIRNDHPEFPKGNLYTEDEFQKKIRKLLKVQKSVPIEDYEILKNKIESIINHISSYKD